MHQNEAAPREEIEQIFFGSLCHILLRILKDAMQERDTKGVSYMAQK